MKKDTNLVTKAPVVTILGHVNHGKTSILDYIRKTHVQESEPAGITQYVRAHQIFCDGKKLTFIDTPGHEVFTEMRSRGGQVADIAVLVVAADDSVMPQTKEAIEHIKRAGASMIVAANKMDLPGANIEKVKQDLSNYDVLVEGWGGDVPIIPVSAKTGENIDQLLEMIFLVAEMLDLKADPTKNATGIVLESKLDVSLGAASTILIKDGSLDVGDYVLCNMEIGKVRALLDTEGKNVSKAGPSDPVTVLGFKEVLPVGSIFSSSKNQKDLEVLKKESEEIAEATETSQEDFSFLDLLGAEAKESEKKTLAVVLKTDVSGTQEAIEKELANLSDDEVEVKIVHSGTGNIVEGDILTAKNAHGIVIGFNVTVSENVLSVAKRERVLTRVYNLIYELVDEVDDVLTGMIDIEAEEIIIGELEVRQTFVLSEGAFVAGCVVRDGTSSKGQKCYIERRGERIYDGRITSLRVLKEEVSKVKKGQECGIILDPKFETEAGDKIVCYRIDK